MMLSKDPRDHTLIMVKPDGVERGLHTQVITRIEQAGLVWISRWSIQFNPELVRQFCAHLLERQDGEEIMQRQIKFYCRGLSLAFHVGGRNALQKVRNLTGATCPLKAAPGTIRGDYANDSLERAQAEHRGLENVVHTSDSAEAFQLEYALIEQYGTYKKDA